MLWERVGKFLLLTFQLGLAVVVIYQFEIESRAFLHLAILTFFGFALHYFLPLALRLPFFLALSLAGIALVLGFGTAAWLVALGLGLIGIASLPLRLSARVGLLLVTAAALACLRVGLAPVPWSSAVWPILGSMFMFRLAVYLYDTQHEKTPAPWTQRLAYFFLLPNVCFPLFPVVDYKTFRRTYYDADRHLIYQVGMLWIARGIAQLVLYRFVYNYGTLPSSEVASFGDLARYMLSTFLLYLRVSGQFHLIVGMLHLFGFNLPETHHLYYLASSFNDFWRRINIYWKDFMMKLFYYPAFFKLRRRGNTFALVASTLVVFSGTWLLHSYQWFWLRGSFPLTLQDGLFWSILGVLVVANSLREARHGRARALGGRRTVDLRSNALLALRTAGTFASICVLWSLWNSESVSEWLSLWAAAARGTPELGARSADWLPLILLGAVAGGTLRAPAAAPAGGARAAAEASFRRYAVRALGSILPLCVIGLPAVYTRLGSTVAEVVDTLRSTRLSEGDAAQLQKGYYEDLVRVDRFNSQLWELYMKRPADWPVIHQTPAARLTGDISYIELVPNVATQFHGATFSNNRHGMRDRDYEVAKPPGTARIAMLGSSHVAGEGVGDGETFEARLEELLAADASNGTRTEVLNFGVGATTPVEALVRLERKALAFDPDAVFYVAHAIDVAQTVNRLILDVRQGVEIPYELPRETLRKAGVRPDTPQPVAERLMAPYAAELAKWVYVRIVEASRAHGALPVFVFLPRISERVPQSDVDLILRLAREAGFVIVDLQGLYAGLDYDAIRLGEWDNHPNARGHELIARRLLEALRTNPALASLGLPPGAPSASRQEEGRQPMEMD
jgi:hypothetical protein